MTRIHQLAALLRTLLGHRGAARAFLRWRPFSITSFRMARGLRDQGLRFRTILDAGANVGQFARAMAETFPDAEVLSFEALPDVAARFRTNLRGQPRVRLIESAVGSHDGILRFFRNEYALASSALPLAPGSRAHTHVEALEVPVGRLDTLLTEEPLTPPVLLKLDLQGFEIEALRGATATLRRVEYVLLEVAFRSSYVGEASFEELDALLRDVGFRFLRPVDFLVGDDGAIIQMDALYHRRTA